MRALVAVRDVVDSWLQRRFDALFFWIMRATGCGKRAIRWHLWLAFILPLITGMVPWDTAKSEYAWAAWLIAVLCAVFVMVVYGACMQRENDWDAEAERRGLMSRADRDGNARWSKCLGLWYLSVGLAGVIPIALGAAYRVLPVGRVLDVVSGLAMLAQGYLCRTPPTPPPKEERALQLAGAT